MTRTVEPAVAPTMQAALLVAPEQFELRDVPRPSCPEGGLLLRVLACAICGSDGRLFLGIDHTAIVVGKTETSLKFYRDVLGMRVAGESENFGTEQEHLNNVFGARLHITGMRAASGPGIEFLEYLAPRDGRPTPADLKSNDVAHWQTLLLCNDLAGTEQGLRKGGVTFVSPNAVTSDGKLGFDKGLLVQDPDGHTVQIIETRAASQTINTSGK